MKYLFFFPVAMQIHVWSPKTAGRSSLSKWLIRIWSYAHRCFVKNAYVFFMGISVELMKSQGDFPHKWIFGDRHISCSSWVCFRRRQNGVHQTPLIISSNEQKLLIWLQPWQNAAWFTYGDLHSSGLKIHAFQRIVLQCQICRYSDCFKMCLFPMEFEYFSRS